MSGYRILQVSLTHKGNYLILSLETLSRKKKNPSNICKRRWPLLRLGLTALPRFLSIPPPSPFPFPQPPPLTGFSFFFFSLPLPHFLVGTCPSATSSCQIVRSWLIFPASFAFFVVFPFLSHAFPYPTPHSAISLFLKCLTRLVPWIHTLQPLAISACRKFWTKWNDLHRNKSVLHIPFCPLLFLFFVWSLGSLCRLCY